MELCYAGSNSVFAWAVLDTSTWWVMLKVRRVYCLLCLLSLPRCTSSLCRLAMLHFGCTYCGGTSDAVHLQGPQYVSSSCRSSTTSQLWSRVSVNFKRAFVVVQNMVALRVPTRRPLACCLGCDPLLGSSPRVDTCLLRRVSPCCVLVLW